MLRKLGKPSPDPIKLAFDEPTPFGAYLGCEQTESTITRAEAAERVQNIFPLVGGPASNDTPQEPNTAAETIPRARWHTKGFFEQTLAVCEQLRRKVGSPTKLKEYSHPSIDGPVSYTHLTLPTKA